MAVFSDTEGTDYSTQTLQLGYATVEMDENSRLRKSCQWTHFGSRVDPSPDRERL